MLKSKERASYCATYIVNLIVRWVFCGVKVRRRAWVAEITSVQQNAEIGTKLLSRMKAVATPSIIECG